MAILESAAFWIIVAAASEIIAVSIERQQHYSVRTARTQKRIKPGRSKSLAKTMIEPFIPALVAVATGVAVLFNKVNQRVTQLDHRVDKLELKLVESFTTKQDFNAAMIRMEEHLVRIENKMDQFIKKCWNI